MKILSTTLLLNDWMAFSVISFCPIFLLQYLSIRTHTVLFWHLWVQNSNLPSPPGYLKCKAGFFHNMCINSSYLLSISPIIKPFFKNRCFCVTFQQYSSQNIKLKVISWQNGWIIGEMDKSFVDFMQIWYEN